MKKGLSRHLLIGALFFALPAFACLLEASLYDFIEAYLRRLTYSAPLWVTLPLPALGALVSLSALFLVGHFLSRALVAALFPRWGKSGALAFAFAALCSSAISLFLLGDLLFASVAYFSDALLDSFALYSPRGIANANALPLSSFALSSPSFAQAVAQRKAASREEEAPARRATRAVSSFFLSLFFFALPFAFAAGFTAFLNGLETVYGLPSFALLFAAFLLFALFLCCAAFLSRFVFPAKEEALR